MSLGSIMALLIACLVSWCLGSAFSHQTHRELPVRSLHFDKSLTMQAAHYIFQSIATSTRRTYSSGERHFMRFCLFNNLISSENPFLPARESTLIHFVIHLANSLSYGTIKVYLAAANKLHIEFGCPLELSSMSLLFKTLCGIKRSLGISGAIAPPPSQFQSSTKYILSYNPFGPWTWILPCCGLLLLYPCSVFCEVVNSLVVALSILRYIWSDETFPFTLTCYDLITSKKLLKV